MYWTLDRPLGALDFFVSGVTDNDDVISLVTVTLRLQMNLGYQGASRVDNPKARSLRMFDDGGRNAVGAEYGYRSRWNDIKPFDKDCAALLKTLDHVPVVDDFVKNVNRRTMDLESEFNNIDRAYHAGTKTAWLGEDRFHSRCSLS